MIRATFKEVQTHFFFYNVIKICTVQLKSCLILLNYTPKSLTYNMHIYVYSHTYNVAKQGTNHCKFN